jgi:hypothetical protein
MAHRQRSTERSTERRTGNHTHSMIYDYSRVYHLSLHPAKATELAEHSPDEFAEAVCGKWFRPAHRGMKEPFCRECIKQSRDYYRKNGHSMILHDSFNTFAGEVVTTHDRPKRIKIKEKTFKPPMENLE